MEEMSSPPLTKRQRRELRRQEKLERHNQETQRRNMTRWLVIVLSVAALGGLVYWAIAAGGSNNSNVAISNVNNPFLGGSEAKVVVTEFSDFSCPACAVLAPTIRELADEYENRIKVVFSGFDIGHTWSEKGLEAGECAYRQNKFWEYGDLIFSKQSEWAAADDAVGKLKEYAQQLGLNAEEFNSCLDSSGMAGEVQKDIAVGQQKNITSTPTVYINNQKVEGAQPIDDFKKIIDEELNK